MIHDCPHLSGRFTCLDCKAERSPTPLVTCTVCNAVGFPERIRDHDCETFRTTTTR